VLHPILLTHLLDGLFAHELPVLVVKHHVIVDVIAHVVGVWLVPQHFLTCVIGAYINGQMPSFVLGIGRHAHGHKQPDDSLVIDRCGQVDEIVIHFIHDVLQVVVFICEETRDEQYVQTVEVFLEHRPLQAVHLVFVVCVVFIVEILIAKWGVGVCTAVLILF